MKLKLITLFVLLLFIFVQGCETEEQQTEIIDNNEELEVQEETNDYVAEDDDFIDWHLSKILNTGKEAKCTATMPDGSSMTIYIKDNKERIESTRDGVSSVMIFDAKIIHSWDVATKQGMIMDIAALEELGGETTSDEDVKDVSEINEEMTNIDCNAEKVPDSMFEIPDDVELVDFVEMIKQMQAGFGG